MTDNAIMKIFDWCTTWDGATEKVLFYYNYNSENSQYDHKITMTPAVARLIAKQLNHMAEAVERQQKEREG